MASKKRYDYHTEAAIATNPGELKRVLRKLVRDAVVVSWHRAEDQSITDLAKTVAKELVP